LAESVDEAQHRWDGGLGAGAGQQVRSVFDRPSQLAALACPGSNPGDGVDNGLGADRRVDHGDRLDQETDRFGPVIGQARTAPGPAHPVDRGDPA
jgi:hypothetical protein